VSTSEKIVVVGLGEILWDMLPGGKLIGSAPTNFAYHAHVLGAKAVVASAVGNDADGQEIAERLAELEIVRDGLAVVDSLPTGTVDVTLGADGQPSYTIHEPVAWDAIPWSEALAALAARCDAVCFGSLAQRDPVSRDTIGQFLAATRSDCLRVFDVNLRQDFATAEIVKSSLVAATILKLNDEELPIVASMVGLADIELDALPQRLIERFGLTSVILTCGADGSWIHTETEKSYRGVSLDLKIADTVGAGDSFTAAVVMGMLAGQPLSAVHERAARIADYVCTQAGATPALPPALIEFT